MSDSMVEDDEDDDVTEGSQDTHQQRTASNDMDSNILSVHNNSDKIDSQLIKKILDEMKCEFTRGTPNKVNDSSGSADENDKINEENEDDPKPVQENFHGIKVSDIIRLDKFEGNNAENEDEVTYNIESDKVTKNVNNDKNLIEEVDNEKVSTETQENETDKNEFENKDEIIDNNSERNETVSNLTNELDEKNQESGSETKNINDSSIHNIKAKKINEKKSLINEDLIINEPRRKRSLRNQTLINKDIDEERNTGLKRSSRRFSKEYNRESVLQNAIARKEKSFSSLGSNDERTYRRGQRSPRQSTVNNKTNSINSNNNNSCSNNSNVSNNVNNIANDPKIVTLKANNSNNNSGNKSNKSPKRCTTSPSNLSITPESSSSNASSLRIIKSPQYDEKLQSTIDNLKSTLEQSSINNQKVSKLDYNYDVLSSSPLVTERLQQKDNSEVIDELNKKENSIIINDSDKNIENVSNKKPDNKDFVADSGTSKKPIYGKLTKKKNRYFKGLKYTFKGGHVKNSNRTWSMTRRKKFELAAKERKAKAVESMDEEEEEEEGEEESEDNENKTEVDCDKAVKNFNNTNVNIHDPKRLSSIFGVDLPEDVKNSELDETTERSDSNINILENSKTNSNSSAAVISSDTNNSNNGRVIRSVKRKLNLDTNSDKDDEVVDKKKYSGSESPQAGEVAPSTQETSEVLQDVPSFSVESIEEDKSLKRLCLCNSKEQYYVSPSSCRSELYCQAIDSLDGRLIGCCNTVDIAAARLVRASVKLPYLVLCNVHHQRIQRHNCCPGCGNFCTQGKFVQCKFGHHFHKDCSLSSQPPAFSNSSTKEDKSISEDETDKPTAVCLHCSSDSFCDVTISLGAHKYPVFLPLQKPPKQVPSAKMTFGGCAVEPVDVRVDNSCVEDEKYLVDDDGNKPLVPSTSLVLPSGLKISSEGLPDAGLKDKLDKLLHVACTVTTPPSGRYTLRNMYQAAKSGDAEKLIYMLASGLNPNHQFREWVMGTALHAACYGGHMTIVHLLIQAGSDIDILDKEQNTPLMIAVLNLHNDIVKYLVKAGADVTFKGGDGMTALHLAAKTGNLEACHYLLSNFNVPRFFIDTVDDGRWTPLVWAAEHCHTDVVRFLLSKRADPLVRDAEQNIGLHWAALAGSVEISEALLNYGSEINSTNAHGDTALHIAARQNAYSCTVLLLSRGSRVDLRNRAGFSALECCLVPDSPTYNAIKLNVELRNFSNSRRISRILINDITRGHEVNPVQCVNAFDDEGIPQDFTYIIENCFTSNISVDRTITSLQFCKCRDNCTTGCCMCGKISIRCWYDNEGKLLPEFNFADPPMLFECNRACTCNKLTCKNRVVQHGIKARFQLFKTSTNKGWGVRTLRLIQKGSYVCEYIGEIISDCEADTREDDSYLFDLDNRDGETYCIDARKYGNIARFINHMCVPNLLPVRVFIDHQDLHFPRIAFFANRDIQANEELGFDYGEKFWIIKYKSFTCTCGAEKCRYSESSIQQTLENYQKKLQQEESSQ